MKKKHLNEIISFIISASLGRFILPPKPDFIPENIWTFFMIAVYAAGISLIFGIFYNIFIEGYLFSEINLWRDGKMRGLWRGNALVKQLKKYSADSTNIRIKVTRGNNLLAKGEKYGFEKIFRDLDEDKKLNQKISVQALLIVPCYKEKHVQARYETHHHSEDISKEDFLETWYKFLENTSTYQGMLNIETRFYFGNHSKWRFYIFSPPADSNHSNQQVVLFSDYDEKRAGSETPMYKVIKHDRSIGGFMTRYFDEIWNESLTPKKLSDAIEKGRIKPQNTYSKVYNCMGCMYYGTCKGFIDKYSKYMVG